MFRLMEPSSGDTLTNLKLLNYAFYLDPYIVFIIACYNNLKELFCTALKNVLNKYLKLLKVLKH
jgi:hypothetical protein